MSRLFVVRHGQACFHGDHYDQLSETGREQARLLGQWLAARDLVWDHIICGPKQRHRETMEIVAGQYGQDGSGLPEPVFMPEFDEHRGAAVTVQHLKKINDMPDTGAPEGFKRYFKKFELVTRAWVAGEIEAPDFESWQSFRARVAAGLEHILGHLRGNIIVFTSGGPMGLVTALCLESSDVKAIELSWQALNSGYAEFLFSGDRFSMTRFNATPHLSEATLHTLI